MSKIFDYAWKGRYATEESEASKVHKNFAKKLERLQIPEDVFLQRLRFCTNLDRVRHVSSVFDFAEIQPNSKFANRYQKSSVLAKEFRDRGNELYKQRDFPDACRAYNLSIVFSPFPSPENELSLAFANRSAAFFETRRFASSLRDIQRAQSSGYPEKSLPRLLERRAKCCSHLNLVALSSDWQNETVLGNLVKEEVAYSEEEKCRRKFCKEDVFRIQSPNTTIPVAEDYVSIQSNPERGRYVVTTKYVKPGTVVVVDEPYAKILLDEFKWDLDHCHYCHSIMNSGIPCPGCVFAIFCNEECLLAAINTHHQYECTCAPFLHILKPPRTLLLAFRILTTLSSEGSYKLYESEYQRKCSEDNSILGFQDGVYNSRFYYPIHHLISHPDKCKTSELLSYTLTSITVTQILDEYSNFFQQSRNDPEFKTFVASLLLLHMQNLPCNAHSLNELILGTEGDVADQIRSTTISEYGAGAFALLSLINHSCDPNVFRVNLHNGKTAVISLRSLNAGEELLDNYGHHYAIEELHNRQRALFQNYYFDCSCISCANPEDWPLLSHLKSLPEVFKCPNCVNRPCLTLEGTCAVCGVKFDLEKLTQELNKKIDEFFEAHEQVLGNEPMTALPSLKSCLEYFDIHLKRPFIRINETEETFKQAMNLIVRSQ